MGGEDTGVPTCCWSYGNWALYWERSHEGVSEKEGEGRVQTSLTREEGHRSVASLKPRCYSYLFILIERLDLFL